VTSLLSPTGNSGEVTVPLIIEIKLHSVLQDNNNNINVSINLGDILLLMLLLPWTNLRCNDRVTRG
jgi:hypothetical protein